MKLYNVYLICRITGDTDEHGNFGNKLAPEGGVVHVLADSKAEAETKALEAITRGLEPHIISVGGRADHSPTRVTVDFSCLEHVPLVT